VKDLERGFGAEEDLLKRLINCGRGLKTIEDL